MAHWKVEFRHLRPPLLPCPWPLGSELQLGAGASDAFAGQVVVGALEFATGIRTVLATDTVQLAEGAGTSARFSVNLSSVSGSTHLLTAECYGLCRDGYQHIRCPTIIHGSGSCDRAGRTALHYVALLASPAGVIELASRGPHFLRPRATRRTPEAF